MLQGNLTLDNPWSLMPQMEELQLIEQHFSKSFGSNAKFSAYNQPYTIVFYGYIFQQSHITE